MPAGEDDPATKVLLVIAFIFLLIRIWFKEVCLDISLWKLGGLGEQVLGDRLQVEEFPTMKHGWTVRGGEWITNCVIWSILLSLAPPWFERYFDTTFQFLLLFRFGRSWSVQRSEKSHQHNTDLLQGSPLNWNYIVLILVFFNRSDHLQYLSLRYCKWGKVKRKIAKFRN